jgi:hypothetical protein
MAKTSISGVGNTLLFTWWEILNITWQSGWIYNSITRWEGRIGDNNLVYHTSHSLSVHYGMSIYFSLPESKVSKEEQKKAES